MHSLGQQLSQLGISSNWDLQIFRSAPRTPLPQDESLQEQLAKVLKRITDEFSPTVNGVFHYYHQKSAPSGQIQDAHKSLHDQLAALDGDMDKALKGARKLYTHIPFIDLLSKKEDLLACVMNIELLASQIFTKTQDLCLLLEDTCRNRSLEYYKATISECEQLASLGTVEAKVGALTAIFTQVINAINLVPEVQGEILIYIFYAALCFKRETPLDNTKVLGEIQELMRKIKEKIDGTAEPDLEFMDPDIEDPPSLESRYLADSSATSLPAENKFRNGSWSTYLTTLPYTRYCPIKTQKNNLEHIAQALYRMESSLPERIKKLCNDHEEKSFYLQTLERELEEDSRVCQGLERLIAVQMRSLAKNVQIAKEIHAGWNYAHGLLAHAKVVRASIEQFKKMLQEGPGAQIIAINRVITCLKPRPLDERNGRIKALVRLHKATSGASLLTPETDASQAIRQMVADLSSTVDFNEARDSKIAEMVFKKTANWESEHHEALQAYLMEGFMRYLHFPKGPVREIEPEFEAVFFMQKFDPVYKKGFIKLLENSPEFCQLHDAYMKESDMKDHVEMMKTVSCVLETLYCTPLLASDLLKNDDVFYRYHRSNRALSVKGDTRRLDWLTEKVKAFKTQHSSLLDEEELKKDAHKKLYNNLFKRFFDINPEVCSKADNEILLQIKEKTFDQQRLFGVVKSLLQRWALERFVNFCTEQKNKRPFQLSKYDRPTDQEIRLLRTLFDEYLTCPDNTLFWCTHYDRGHMEIARQQLSQQDTSSHNTNDRVSSNTISDIWRDIISSYADFRRIIEEQNYELVAATKPYEQAAALLKTVKRLSDMLRPIDPTNKAALLYIEMEEFLALTRVAFSKK